MIAEYFKGRSIFLTALLLAAIPHPAYPTLLAADLAAQGDGLLTVDDRTALEWLDLTATMNTTVTEARETWLGEGFRYAVQDEVETLFRNAGISHITINDENPNATSGNLGPVNQLIDLLGETGRGENGRYISGVYGVQLVYETGFPPYAEYQSALLSAEFNSTAFAQIDPLPYTSSNANYFPNRNDAGLFLVRKTTVSEPTSATLIILSLFGFVFARFLRVQTNGFAITPRRSPEPATTAR